VGIKLPGSWEENLCKVGVNTPISDLVGMGQRVTGDLAANAPVIKPLLCRPQADLDVPQAFTIGKLKKPGRETDPRRRSSSSGNGRGTARRMDGTREGEKSPSVERRSSDPYSSAISFRKNAGVWNLARTDFQSIMDISPLKPTPLADFREL